MRHWSVGPTPAFQSPIPTVPGLSALPHPFGASMHTNFEFNTIKVQLGQKEVYMGEKVQFKYIRREKVDLAGGGQTEVQWRPLVGTAIFYAISCCTNLLSSGKLVKEKS